jgi:NAD(P)-dependent dehydrogenase (short-subunit alcohol dehydrogenase family)
MTCLGQFPMESLAQMRVIVTGAAGGIGQALVRALLAARCRVLAVGSSEASLRGLRAEFEGGKDLHCFAMDLRSPDCGARVVDESVLAFGGLDALINNAGVGRHVIRDDIFQKPLRFWETTPDMWQRFIDVNATAPFLLMRAAVPRMMAQGFGRIINITTSLSSMIGTGMSPYGPTKACTEALTSCAANDLRNTGITANVVVPGATTDTGMVPAHAPVERERLARPEAMVPPVLWLLSDSGSRTTGMRFRANLWNAAAPVAQAIAASGQAVAWTSIATGQLVDLVNVKS